MVDAIPALETDKAVRLFGKYGVMNRSELSARAEIHYEQYAKDILIEARTMTRMASKQLIPAMIRYSGELGSELSAIAGALPGADVTVIGELLAQLSRQIRDAKEAESLLDELTRQAQSMEEGRDKAVFVRDRIIPAMNALRAPIDQAELIVDKREWPMPCYADLMFEV